MGLAPAAHDIDHRTQAYTQFSERILDPGRYLSENFSAHQPIALHLAQLLRQHFLRYPRQQPNQLGKSLGAGQKMKNQGIFHRPPIRASVNSAGQLLCFAFMSISWSSLLDTIAPPGAYLTIGQLVLSF